MACMGLRTGVYRLTWIDDQFPNATDLHDVTSDPTNDYNCIAWAAEDDTEWWSHLPGYKWPFQRTPLVVSLVGVFRSLGYKICDSDELEDGYDKVALYAKKDIWKHAARQLPSGRWASKLGPDEDIEHETPTCLCGEIYGNIHCIMRRRRT